MKLTSLHEDALKEIGNVAAGRASTSLSRLIGKQVVLKVPEFHLCQINEIPELIKIHKNLVVGPYIQISGSVPGAILIVFPLKHALHLVDLLTKKKNGHTKYLSEEDQMCLEELGNILASAYMVAFKHFANITPLTGSAQIVSTFGESVVDFIKLNIGKSKDCLLVKTEFSIKSTEIQGDFIMVLNGKIIDRFAKIIEKKVDKVDR